MWYSLIQERPVRDMQIIAALDWNRSAGVHPKLKGTTPYPPALDLPMGDEKWPRNVNVNCTISLEATSGIRIINLSI